MSGDVRVDAAALEDMASALFAAAGCPAAEARTVAAHLVLANLSGHDSHGVIRLRDYLPWLGNGMVRAGRRATIVHETPLALTIDGDLGLGQAIGEEAIALTLGKAQAHGIAAVAIRNTGHLGRIGHWAERCAQAGFASLHLVNTSGFGVLVAPHGSARALLSANPFAAGFPVRGGEPVVLDISTAAIAEGKIKVARNAGKPLPEGCVIDAQGRPTRDAAAFYGPPRGAILPFGGHKGYALSVIVELFAGALTGGGCTDAAAPHASALRNNMASFVVHPDLFGAGELAAEEAVRLLDALRGAPPADPAEPVLVPGDVERRTRSLRLRDGVPLDATSWAELLAAAARFGVAVPATRPA